MVPAAAVACTVDTKTSRSYRVRSWVAIHMLPCAFLGCLQPATTQPATSPIIHMLPCAFVGCLQPCPPGHQPNRPPTQPAPATIPPMPSTCYRAHSWVASALSWLGPLWHWVVCGIGQLHPVHPCFTAQLLCAVLLRSQDRNRLRTPGKHHLIIHHHPSSSIIIGNMWHARRAVTCGTPALG